MYYLASYVLYTLYVSTYIPMYVAYHHGETDGIGMVGKKKKKKNPCFQAVGGKKEKRKIDQNRNSSGIL